MAFCKIGKQSLLQMYILMYMGSIDDPVRPCSLTRDFVLCCMDCLGSVDSSCDQSADCSESVGSHQSCHWSHMSKVCFCEAAHMNTIILARHRSNVLTTNQITQ